MSKINHLTDGERLNEQDFSRTVREHGAHLYRMLYKFRRMKMRWTTKRYWCKPEITQNFRGERICAHDRSNTQHLHSCDRKKRNENLRTYDEHQSFTDSAMTAYRQQPTRRISQLGPFDRAIILLWLENMSYERDWRNQFGISNGTVRLFRTNWKTSETTKE